MTKNLYLLLGVAPDAPAETIAAACARKLEQAQDHNTKVLLRHARDVLCHPASRTAYDSRLRGAASGLEIRVSDGEKPAGHSRIRNRVIAIAIVITGLGLVMWTGLKKGPPASQPPTAKTVFMVVEPPRTMPPPSAANGPAVPPADASSPEQVYAKTAPSVVVVTADRDTGSSRGSGVVIGPQSIITNCHVVDRAVNVRVKAGDAEFTATSGTSDTYLDLCVLDVPGLSAPEARRGSVKALQVGQTVYAIGAPQGLDRTLSQGLISALRDTPDGTVIQTSAPISPGSSGGGLFDAEGKLIGITTFQTKTGQNLNFALPVDWLDSMKTR